jgi:hypothetical protein
VNRARASGVRLPELKIAKIIHHQRDEILKVYGI